MTKWSEDESIDAAARHQAADAPPSARWHVPQPERLPQPTAWPFVIAIGSTMLAWGVVTSWVVSLVGGMMLVLGIGGWIERMRDERRT